MTSVPTAPIPPADLERSLRELGEATMFPGAAYIDSDILVVERRNLFDG